MKDSEHRSAAKHFIEVWKDKGYEKGHSQKYWIQLLGEVLGVEHAAEYIQFEDQVHLDHTSFIDAMIPETKVMIEQKSIDKDLNAPIRQSDGTLLTPFQQAKRYITELPLSKHPRWVVTCNFREFHVYDMEKPGGDPEVIKLENLDKEYYRLQFLADTGNEHIKREMEISLKAGELVGVLYDEILKEYNDPTDPVALKSLNMLCVRLVFCLYAEDAGIFGSRSKFHDYLKRIADRNIQDVRRGLIDLFRVLDTIPEERDPYMDDMLASFPYVNGGLFADENIIIPRFNEKIVNVLLKEASEDFDWSGISPTIFGAVFESTLNPETRRSGGMHYTSVENIHKVIDPLFLDKLKAELESIKEIAVQKTRESKMRSFQTKLASLRFLDPACGSGNFLTETYISLRRLENEVLFCLTGGQIVMGEAVNPIRVSIGQFYGIEVNDFAVTVAKTALWIAESQMMKETEDIVHMNLDFLPLKSYANIVEGNALRMDWESVIPKAELSYIMGNPPFVGHQWRTGQQVEDMAIAFHDLELHGKLDYVCSWYNKAADYMVNTKIETAFVSTNSIAQGESVGVLWGFLFEKKNVEIQFAYKTFVWASEAKDQAAVHCVIIGFTWNHRSDEKWLFENDRKKLVNHINGYLLEAPDIFIQSRGKQLTKGLPEMSKGSQPTDGGNLLLSPEEKDEMIRREPLSEKWIHRFMMGADYINNSERYCLWLVGADPSKLLQCPMILKRADKVKELRLKSPTKSVQNDAQTPTLFTQRRQPKSKYMVIPRVSSINRRYIPIGFLEPDVIAGDKLQFIETESLYILGVLISNVHMAWMRVVGGRLKSDYSYSPAVYNNFPWPDATEEQKKKIEETAQGIIDARALYPNSSLAALYDEIAMPAELRKAHQENDKAVMALYGFRRVGDDGKKRWLNESECVAELMKMYQKMVEK